MTKPIGAICNLDCEYCYDLKKLALYPEGSPRMSRDLLDNYIRQMLEAQAGPEVEIDWQGGEPTVMGLPFFEEAMTAVERHRRPGQRVEHNILCTVNAANGDHALDVYRYFRDELGETFLQSNIGHRAR